MKLGLSLGYSGAYMSLPVDLVRKAEELGYDSVWTAEAYGSDAFSPLAYLAAVTEKIRLGTGVIQLAGRTAANAAMTAATIDALAGGDRGFSASACRDRRSWRVGTASPGVSPTLEFEITSQSFARSSPVKNRWYTTARKSRCRTRDLAAPVWPSHSSQSCT